MMLVTAWLLFALAVSPLVAAILALFARVVVGINTYDCPCTTH